MSRVNQLAKWWLENYDKPLERTEKEEIEILLLEDEEFYEFVTSINDVEALQALCSFLKGALDERREQYLKLLKEKTKKE